MAALALVVVLAASGWLGRDVAGVGTAYVAKTLCSGVFVSRRDTRSVLDGEIRANDPGILRFVDAEVDRDARLVRARLFRLVERVAVFRDGLGCTLAIDGASTALTAGRATATVTRAIVAPGTSTDATTGPHGVAQNGTTSSALAAALDDAFSEPTGRPVRRTRAVVVARDGQILVERASVPTPRSPAGR